MIRRRPLLPGQERTGGGAGPGPHAVRDCPSGPVAGEFPVPGALVLAGLPSCLACCCGDSGAAGVSTDGGRGQRRARSAWRFWAVWRLRAPIAAAIWDQVAPRLRAASMNASSPCSSSAASFRAAVIAVRAAVASMLPRPAVPLMPARAVAAVVSSPAGSLSWFPGRSPPGWRPPVVDVRAVSVLPFALPVSGGMADVLVTGPGG